MTRTMRCLRIIVGSEQCRQTVQKYFTWSRVSFGLVQGERKEWVRQNFLVDRLNEVSQSTTITFWERWPARPGDERRRGHDVPLLHWRWQCRPWFSNTSACASQLLS